MQYGNELAFVRRPRCARAARRPRGLQPGLPGGTGVDVEALVEPAKEERRA